MKIAIIVSIYLIDSFCVCLAELPQNPSYSDFEVIIQKAPFNKLPAKKVVVAEKKPVPKPPKEEYVLKGMTKFSEGWFIVIANKKAPNKDYMIRQGEENELGVKIVKVETDKYDYRKNEVHILADGKTQVVTYDLALLNKSSKIDKESKAGNSGQNTKRRKK